MRTFIVSAFLIGSLLVAAPVAHALTVDEINAKVQELLAQIATLQQQIATLAAGQQTVPATNPSSTPTTETTAMCYQPVRVLRAGVVGDDVVMLQKTLKENGYFSGDTTGYFGKLTQAAVEKFQASQNIVSSGTSATTGFGMVGPATRRILWRCNDTPTTNAMRFEVNPARGPAPLEVTFKTWISGFRVPSHTYTIDFGDGTSEAADDCFAPADACIEPGVNTHTYAKDGTYTAILYRVIDPCVGQTACRAAIHREVAAKKEITVGAIACTKEYMPVCGAKPIVCITTPCNPVPTTYGNKCMMEADGASFLYAGQCRAETANPADDAQCQAWYDGCNTCSRSAPGGPAICTLRACVATSSDNLKPYCKSYFSDTANKAPVISSFSGPSALKLGEQGTWTIQASDPENGTLTYDITWGDENDNVFPWAVWDAMKLAVTQSTTFTHSYSVEGTYTVSITVRDDKGNTAQSRSIVKVGAAPVACTEEYAPVCGAKPIVCVTTPCNPVPTTYSNRCKMTADSATFLYGGVCSATTTVAWNPTTDPQCKIWSDGCNTCSRSTPGGLGACTLMACVTNSGATSTAVAYCKERFATTTPTTNKAPSISSFSGPTTLQQGQAGTWTIKATDPEGGSLSYDVIWGDEQNFTMAMSVYAGARTFVQTGSLSHTYYANGTYTVKVTVRDAMGATATASATVQIGNSAPPVACTMQYDPVCGRPAGCANTCPVGQYCAMVCQLYPVQTYGNRCMLDAAGATFERAGAC